MKKSILAILVLLLLITSIIGCTETSSVEKDRQVQENILTKAQTAVPAYQTQNYLARKAINEYMQRMDATDKLWYIYLMSESGAYIGYHISRTYPISISVAMSNPQRIIKYGGNLWTSPAPGIDGVFYNGVDPTLYYCFDAETDALIMFTTEFIAYDFPLDLNVPLLRIKVE